MRAIEGERALASEGELARASKTASDGERGRARASERENREDLKKNHVGMQTIKF